MMNRAKNKARIFLLAGALFSFYSFICKAQSSFVNKTYTFSVGSTIKKTDLKITEGDEVRISASGKVVVHGFTGSVGPEGMDGYRNNRIDQVFPYGALLYKIGDDDWNIVDPQDTIVSDRTGVLKFIINDNDPVSNGGKFAIKVTVKTLKAENAKKSSEKTETKRAVENTPPHSSAGGLTLSELQKAGNYNLNEVQSFLTSKQFKLDDGSNGSMNKYSFKKDNVTASIVKDARENQTTFTTSSASNYKEIKASLDKYGYTYRKGEKKVNGVSKYVNAKYTLSIVQVTLNGKPQYFFTIKKR